MSNNWSEIPVLVTGAGGFITSHLTRELVRLGAKVNVIVRPHSDLWRLSDIIDRIQIFPTDITNAAGLMHDVKKINPQIIFHLAAKTDINRSLELLPAMMAVNFQGTVNLLNALQDTSFSCFINTGTCEEYGVNEAPFVETQREAPVSPYSFSKAAATHYCQMLHKTQGLPIVTLRPFLTYGPMQTAGTMLIPALVKQCLHGGKLALTLGEQTRELNYVDDIVRGYLLAAFSPAAIGEIINLGNGIEYQIKEVVNTAIKISDSQLVPLFGKLPYRPGEALHFYCSCRKAYELLGWKTQVGLEDGLKKTFAWARENQNRL
ncbi:MAG: GDP-mannose 4,6-dehydratase [Candidatus Schekmanbacteria bacterium]|nr:GDP-mannose 4,6-dehydratase [Candidatus Schekmanbacteria bacterium]